MLDSRIYTFLTLCELMNYRRTAEKLLMTQPAVTQHIQFLEREYDTKLFEYTGKTLYKTSDCIKLEQYARSVVHNEKIFKTGITNVQVQKIAIGATRTIGDYSIDNMMKYLLKHPEYEIALSVDNTQRLLNKLNHSELDFALLEGYFNKHAYDYTLIRNEELVGICSKDHIFAGKEVNIEDIFHQHLILREEGSGTRNVLGNFLKEHNFSYDNFRRNSVINSINMIEFAVLNKNCISFVYKAVAKHNENLATFRINGERIYHEFNCVYLKNSANAKFINSLLERI